MEKLPLPANITEDARTAFFEADRSGVINDYAKVDTGGTVGDGFNVTANTDADTIMNATTGKKARLFIQLPSNEARRDHILRSLASASIREDFKKGDVWNIIVLNTKAIKTDIGNFNFNDDDAKNYFLTIAKKLSKKLSGNDILVVNIDDFARGLTAEEFFSLIPGSHIIALSSQGIDTVKYFDDKKESDEFLSKGLNPGHVFLLTQMRLLRSKSITNKADQDKVALIVAKVITALEPNGNLGSLSKFFTLAEPLIESETPIADLDKEILKTLAAFFQANYDYLLELHLDSKTLSEIHEQVKANALAYNEQADKTNKILKSVKKILASGLATLGETMARGFRMTRAELDDMRNMALPGMERTLIDSGDKNRDEVIGRTKQTLSQAVTQLISDAKTKHDDTQKIVAKNLSAIVEVAQDNIAERNREQMTDLTGTFFDLVRNAVKRLLAESIAATTKAAKDINENTARLLLRAIGVISDHTTNVGDNTTSSVSEELRRSADELKGFGRAQTNRSIEELTKNTGDRVAKAQANITKSTTSAVADTEFAMVRALTEESNDLKSLVEQAVKKLIAETKGAVGGLTKDINKNTIEAVKRAEKILADALTQAEDEIKKRVVDEHLSTRTEVAATTAKDLAKIASVLTAHTTAQHEGTKQTISGKVIATVADARTALEQVLLQQSQEVKDLVSDSVAKAIKKIIAHNAGATGDLRGDINTHTTSAVKRAQQILTDALTQTEEEIKRRLVEEGQGTRDEVKAEVAKNAAKSSAEIMAELKQQFSGSQRRLIAAMGDARASIEQGLSQESQTVKDLMSDLMTAAVKRILAESKGSVAGLSEGINVHTASVVKKAQDLLANALAQAEDEIKKRVSEESQAGRDDIKSSVTKHVTQSAGDVIAQLRRTLVDTQKQLALHTSGTVSDAQGVIEKALHDTSQEVKDVVHDALVAAIRKIVAEGKGSVKDLSEGINVHTTGQVKKSQQLLINALAQAEEELKIRLAEEGQVTREDSKGNVTKTAAQTATDVIVQVRKQLLDTQKQLATHTTGTVGDAQVVIEKGLRDTSQEVKDVVHDALVAAIRKIVAEGKGSVKDLSEGINVHTTGQVKKSQQLLINALAQAEEELKIRLAEEGQATREESKGNVTKSATQTAADVIAQLRKQLLETQKQLAAHTTGTVSDAQLAIEKGQQETSQEVKDVVNDVLATVIRKIVAEGKASVKDLSEGINVHTTGQVKKSQQLLINALAHAEEELKIRLAEEGQVIREESKGNVAKSAAHTASDVIAQVRKQLSDTQKQLATHTTGTVGDAQIAIEKGLHDTSQEVKDLVNDALAAAIRKIVADGKGSMKDLSEGINVHTTKVVQKAQAALGDTVAEAEGAITKRVGEEGQVTRDELMRKTSGEIAQARAGIGEQLSQEHQATQRRLMKHGEEVGGTTREVATDEINKISAEIGQKIDERLRDAIKRIVAQGNEHTKAIQSTEGTINRGNRWTRALIIEAEGEIKKILNEESEKASDEIARLGFRNRQLIRNLAGRLTTGLIHNHLFASIYRFELERIVSAADGVPMHNLDVGAGEVRTRRILGATDAAYIAFTAGNTANAIRNAAAGAYQLPGPSVVPYINAASVNAVNDITGSQALLDIVEAFRGLQSISNAPNPDIKVGETPNYANRPQVQVFENQSDEDLRQPLNELLDQLKEKLKNLEVEEE